MCKASPNQEWAQQIFFAFDGKSCGLLGESNEIQSNIKYDEPVQRLSLTENNLFLSY